MPCMPWLTVPVADRPVADHHFETVATETIYRGAIIALRTDEVRMPGGATAIREVVEHYGAVAVAALAVAQSIAVRRAHIPAVKVIGLRQMAAGLAVVAATAVGVLA